jgi:PAS domain S-box-containing protein
MPQDEITRAERLAELRRSERELADFFENASIPFHWVGPDGIILRANRAELEIFGYARDEYVGHPIAEFHVEQEVIEDILERLRRGETLHDYEARMRAKDGAIRHVLINSSVMWENGEFIHTRGLTRDISSRKRSERRTAMEHAVTRLLAESRTLAEASRKTLQVISECLEWQFGALWEVDDDAKRLRCVEVWRSATRDFSAFEAICRQFTFPMGVGLPGRVWKNREATWISDVTQDNNFPRASVASRADLRGAFAFPIKLGGEILGVMEFFSSDIRQPDEPLLKTVEAIGREIGQFAERLRAEQELHKKNQELQAAIEASEVMQEELRAQNEELFQTQAAVENERKRYQDLFEFAPDGDLVTDIHGNIFEANQAAVKQLNTPLAALVGKPITDFVHPQDKMAFCAELMSIPIDSAVKKWEGRLVPTESNPFDGALTVIAVRDAREHPVGLRWLIHDVTEHKRVVDALRRSEEKLRQQSQELEQQLIASGRLVSLGEITASMAHEFNNPLGIIMGFIEDMLSGTDPADPNYRPLKIVDEESKRCKKIISDLMEYARPRSTDLCLTNVATSIEKTLQLVENRLYKQKVAVVKAFEADLPQIYADPQQLEQVLINLYLNAIDAMPDGGTLTVETQVEWVDRSPSGIVLRLADTGFGIDDNNLAKIFQPFFSAKKRRGLGLGLPICARIVKNHGGRIDVESQPGQGTTFKLYLPLNHEVVGNQGEAG